MVVTSECLKLQGEPAVAAAKHSAKFRRLASLFCFSLRFIALCKPCMRVLPCACVIKGGMASGRPFHPYTRHVALELGGTLNSRPWLNTWLIGTRKSMSSAGVPFEVFLRTVPPPLEICLVEFGFGENRLEFHGMQLEYKPDGVRVHQTNYSLMLIEKFKSVIDEQRAVHTPSTESAAVNTTPLTQQQMTEYRSKVGCLLYLACGTCGITEVLKVELVASLQRTRQQE